MIRVTADGYDIPEMILDMTYWVEARFSDSGADDRAVLLKDGGVKGEALFGESDPRSRYGYRDTTEVEHRLEIADEFVTAEGVDTNSV